MNWVIFLFKMILTAFAKRKIALTGFERVKTLLASLEPRFKPTFAAREFIFGRFPVQDCLETHLQKFDPFLNNSGSLLDIFKERQELLKTVSWQDKLRGKKSRLAASSSRLGLVFFAKCELKFVRVELIDIALTGLMTYFRKRP